jgi:glycosyltransferase involved in cell wall biosynthesis
MTAHILFVDTGKEWGGGTNSLLLLARGLRQRGHDVDVVFNHDYAGAAGRVSAAFGEAGIAFHLLPPPAASVWHKLARELTRLLLAFSPGGRDAALHRLERRLRVEPMAQRLAAQAKTTGATLLVGNNQPSSNQEVLRAGQLARLPVVLHVRKTTRLCAAERDLANAAARRIICVSDSVREHYLAQGLRADLCLTVPNGIDPAATHFLPREAARTRLDLPADDFVVGTVCSLLPLKCVDHLIEAFAAARPALGEQAVCVVIGEGRERGRLELLAAKLGIAAQVRFAGFQDDAAGLLPALDVFVLASRQEGMPRSILEAMLAERAVVAANVSGCRDVVIDGETGFLYPHGDVGQLAARLQSLAGDPAMRRRLGERGRAVVMERYTLSAHIERMAAVIDEVAA